ncbi:MAG: GPW/gp25 family protein [Butyrivibrio sp.]|nr:GPW/gp25 family protein [Acetatifactor muris]MCM1560011.1 GPW/gp25 family protein [Butyrivibrio sp.]
METGWKFPFRISKDHGRVEISGAKDNIRESVEIILRTEPGERLLHPAFGTRLHQFLFEGMDSQTEEMIRREVRHSLHMWEKRIRDIEVETDMGHTRQGELRVIVSYRIAGLEDRDRVEVRI